MVNLAFTKKGVSPLIATVLLIAFAVALGAVVMNWGRSYVENTAESVRQKSDRDIQCSQDVKLKFQSISNVPQICYGGGGENGYIRFMIYNDGTVKVDSISVNIIGVSSIISNSSINGTAISVSNLLRKNVTYDYTSYGDIQLVKIVPHVTINGINTTCPGSALERSSAEMRNCT